METGKLTFQAPDIRPRPRTSGPWSVFISNSQAGQVYRARTSGVQPGHPAPAQKSGEKPGNPAPRTRTYRSYRRQPGHLAPPEAPDIRPDARTFSPASLRIVKGRSPCTSSPTRLYILLPLPLSRVSDGLAHIFCESLAHPLGYFSSELTTSSEKIPQADSRPLQGKTIKTSSRRRTVPLYPYLC